MHFLTIADTSDEVLSDMVASGLSVKQDRDSYSGVLTGRSVGLFFMKPSTRTRVSSEVAVAHMGGHPVVIRGDEIGIGDREPTVDVARVLSRYLDALGLRVFDHGDLVDLAAAASIPIVNLLSDLEHPCQAIADLMTIAEHRPLEGAVVAYVGDGNNVAHSLAAAVAKTGGEIRVATPPGYEMGAPYRSYASLNTNDPLEAVAGADVVYTDVWASMGQEDEATRRRSAFAGFTVDGELLAAAGNGAIFLHCLPAHRGEEVSAEVMEHPRSRVFDQAENRLHAFKAILHRLIGG